MRRALAAGVAVAAVTAVLLAGCSSGPAGTSTPTPSASSGASTGAKVLLVTEENQDYAVISRRRTPYLASVARQYGLVTRMDAGYPASCPSLPAYLLLTSGSDHGVCDDGPPSAHRITGPNLFQQVADSGRQWRGYAESMPAACAAQDSADGVYLVRHAPAPYYVSERSRCPGWDLPLGTTTAGALHDDVVAGRLPAFSFVTPNACHDMHGGPACSGDVVSEGDTWLATWLPTIMAGPDYRSGELTIIITWDEGSSGGNHIPTLVISPTTHQVTDTDPATHCTTLRTIEDLLRLPALGCAATAGSLVSTLHLRVG